MNKLSFSTLFFSGFLALSLLGGLVTPVSAIAHQPAPVPTKPNLGSTHHRGQPDSNQNRILTFITLKEPANINLGKPFILSGFINDQYKRPVANKSILFTINGKFLGQTRSNESGLFERKFTNGLDAGTYTINATTNLSHTLAPASTSTTLKILPTDVRIQTVPPIPGIPFQMNGTQFVSGENGIADIKIDKIGQYRLEVLADQYHSTSKRIEFARWLDESYQPYQDIQVPTDKVIQVGFNVYHLVGQSFLDLEGLPVDPTRIKEFTIRSAQGDMFVLNDGQPRWIPASRVARRVNGLEETQLLYSVIGVTVDGSNVVNQSQQRFFTYPVENWPISLLLYSLRISAKDGLFGSPVGKSVNLQFPDGHVENYPLDQNGTVEIHSLARGNYSTELVGTYGLSSRTPVALSRNQDVSTKVVTYLDLAAVGLLGVIVALGLLLYGRPSLLNLRKKNQQTTRESEWGLLPEANAGNLAELYDYRYTRYETVKVLDDLTFHAATGVDREIFEKILAQYQKEFRKTGKQPKLSGADQILLTLLFLREHRSEFEIGHIYGVSEGTVRRTIKKVKNTMMKSVEFDLSGNNLLQPGNTLIEADLFEAAEKPVVEPSDDL
jgi:hypothetical protein